MSADNIQDICDNVFLADNLIIRQVLVNWHKILNMFFIMSTLTGICKSRAL